MRAWILIVLLHAMPAFAADQSAAKTRCGWFENPAPGNAWLTDRDGEFRKPSN